MTKFIDRQKYSGRYHIATIRKQPASSGAAFYGWKAGRYILRIREGLFGKLQYISSCKSYVEALCELHAYERKFNEFLILRKWPDAIRARKPLD